MNSRTGCAKRDASSAVTVRRSPSRRAAGRQRRPTPSATATTAPTAFTATIRARATRRSAITGPRWRAGTASSGSRLSSQNSGISTTTGSPITTARSPIAPRPTRRNGSSARDRCSTRPRSPSDPRRPAVFPPGRPPGRRRRRADGVHPREDDGPQHVDGGERQHGLSLAETGPEAGCRASRRTTGPAAPPGGRGESGSPARGGGRRPARPGGPAARGCPRPASPAPGASAVR